MDSHQCLETIQKETNTCESLWIFVGTAEFIAMKTSTLWCSGTSPITAFTPWSIVLIDFISRLGFVSPLFSQDMGFGRLIHRCHRYLERFNLWGIAGHWHFSYQQYVRLFLWVTVSGSYRHPPGPCQSHHCLVNICTSLPLLFQLFSWRQEIPL